MIRQTGGFGRRRDLDQVELGGFRLRNASAQRHDAELLAVHADQADFGGVDFAVDSLLLLVQSYCAISMKDQKTSRASRDAGASISGLSASRPPRWRRASKASRGIAPRSSPPRVRTATVSASFSLSPTTS